MNRSDLTAILADIDDTISRVRDLSTSPERAAALQCLADARRHLGQVRPIPTSPFPPEWEGKFIRIDSVPPSATDNQRVRSEADEAFRESRRILREVLR